MDNEINAMDANELDINELDVNDIGLKEMFGTRFHDKTESKPVTAGCGQVCADNTPTPVKTARSEPECDVAAEWQPPRPAPNWKDNLKDCVKATVTFGGLNLLIFWWQQAGLMADSIAVPSMCVCAGLCGLGIGKVVGRGIR